MRLGKEIDFADLPSLSSLFIDDGKHRKASFSAATLTLSSQFCFSVLKDRLSVTEVYSFGRLLLL